MALVFAILVGCIAGFAAGKIMRGGGFGFIVNTILGLIGGVVGGWLLGMLGVSIPGGPIGGVITAFIGAVIVLGIASLFNKKK